MPWFMVLNVSVYYQSVVSVLSVYCQMMIINKDSFFGWKMKNILASVLSVMPTRGKIMSVCCQSVVGVLSDADNRLTILPVYCQKGRFSRQPVVNLLSGCCQM